MASFIGTQEVHDVATAGSISRHGARVTTRTLNQAAGVAEGLLLAPSGTAGLECISPSTEAGVKASVGFSVYRPMSEDLDSTHHYADNEAVAVMEEGHMYVLAEGTVVANRPVFARITSDGGDNTVLGKVRGDSDVVAGGVVITPDASFAAAVSSFTIVLSDGLVTESFTFTSDASPTTAEVAAGLVALIDASANFAATGTVTISITSTTGIVEIISIDERLPVTTPARAVRVPGCYFDASRSGAGLVEIRLNKQN
jgi:hypothetical protein